MGGKTGCLTRTQWWNLKALRTFPVLRSFKALDAEKAERKKDVTTPVTAVGVRSSSRMPQNLHMGGSLSCY